MGAAPLNDSLRHRGQARTHLPREGIFVDPSFGRYARLGPTSSIPLVYVTASSSASLIHVADVAVRLGVTTHSLYAWIKKFGPDSADYAAAAAEQAEIKRLKKELKRVTEERDILKKAAAYFAKQSE